MKRFLPLAAVTLLSAGAFHLLLTHVLRETPPPTQGRTSAAPVFALGGLISPGDINGGDAALVRLAAAHCGEEGSGEHPARPEELSGVVPWDRGTVVYVLCPAGDGFRRESITGYLVGCQSRTASLSLKLGRMTSDALSGCLVVIGDEPSLEQGRAGEAGEGRSAKSTFRINDRRYAWTAPSDEVVPLTDR